MEKLTKAQTALLKKAYERGGVSRGGYGNSQHHRPAYALEGLGYLEWGRVPLSQTSFVARFLGGVPPGLYVDGWCLTERGQKVAEKMFGRTA
jgi:hypothetical protein